MLTFNLPAFVTNVAPLISSYAYAIQTLSYDLTKQSRKVGYLDNLLQGGWGPNVQNMPAFSLYSSNDNIQVEPHIHGLCMLNIPTGGSQ